MGEYLVTMTDGTRLRINAATPMEARDKARAKVGARKGAYQTDPRVQSVEGSGTQHPSEAGKHF